MGWLIMSSTYFNIKPLSEEEVGNFFYLRGGESDYSLRRELDFLLNQITKSKGGKAFAISGTRGSGKSTLINKLIESVKEDKGNYLIVKVDVPKKFDESFLLKRILRKVCEAAVKDEDVKKNDELLIDILVKLMRLDYQTKHSQQVGNKTSFSGAIKGSLSKIIATLGVELNVQKALEKVEVSEIQVKEYDLERVQNDLEKLLEELNLRKLFKGIVIIVDETDKSNYLEAVKTLDNIKPLFWLDNCYYIFVGSQEFYADYLRGIKTGRKTLLDSLFTKIIYLPPFTRDDLIGMLEKRFSGEISEETSKIVDIIATISKGSPRDAMRYCDLLAGERGSIEEATVADLGNVINDTFPRFPPENLKYFIPLSSSVSEIAHEAMTEPTTESCAVSIIACILEMQPHFDDEADRVIFNCEKEKVRDAISGDSSEKYGYSRTEFEAALTFLYEHGSVIEEKGNIKLIVLKKTLSEYKSVLDMI
jgi:energy-coupling factor transporter ATP-binding protein EcfA2